MAKKRRRSRLADDGHSAWHRVWTSPFNVMREIYLLLDRNTKVRSQGRQTVGRIIGVRTSRVTGWDVGVDNISEVHYVKYRFDAGDTYTAEKTVDRRTGLKEGFQIRVYYMSGLFGGLHSALDREPFDIALDRNPKAVNTRRKRKRRTKR